MVLAEKGHIAADAHHWLWPRKRPEPAINVLTNRDKGRVRLSISKLEYASHSKDHVVRVPVKKQFLMVQSFWQMLERANGTMSSNTLKGACGFFKQSGNPAHVKMWA